MQVFPGLHERKGRSSDFIIGKSGKGLHFGWLFPMKAQLTEIRKTLGLAVPMILGQVAVHSLWMIDTAMIGRVGVLEVAAAGFAGTVFGIFLFFGFGLSNALSVLAAQAVGAGNIPESKEILRNGLIIAWVFGIGSVLFITPLQDWVLSKLGQPADVQAMAGPYFFLLMLAVPMMLFYQNLKNYCEARGQPWLPLVFFGLSIVINIFLNWVLIFGKLGAPALGLVGAGIATALARLISTFVFYLYLERMTDLIPRWGIMDLVSPTKRHIREIIGIGLPMGVSTTFEICAFNFATLMMGWLGAITLAAHQVAIQMAALTFMVPLGLSFAVSIRIGRAVGAGDIPKARRIGFANTNLAAVFMGLMAVVFFIFNEWFPLIFIGQEVEGFDAVVRLAAQLIVVAGIFQVVDGIQILAQGALRGFKDVKVPMVLIFLAFWVICLPVGFWLGFELDSRSRLFGIDWSFLGDSTFGLGMGGIGIWIGLAVGLAVNAAILVVRFHLISKRALRHSGGLTSIGTPE